MTTDKAALQKALWVASGFRNRDEQELIDSAARAHLATLTAQDNSMELPDAISSYADEIQNGARALLSANDVIFRLRLLASTMPAIAKLEKGRG